MSAIGLSFLEEVEDVIVGLKRGSMPIDLAMRNIWNHLHNTLHHTARTSEIDIATRDVIAAAERYRDEYDLAAILIDPSEKMNAEKRLQEITEAYNRLYVLIEAAAPSDISRALGN